VTILDPVSPVYPLVSLEVSSTTLSNCSDLILDPSQSINTGGSLRSWSLVHWSVTGTGGDVAVIENQLNAFYSSNKTTEAYTVSTDLLRHGQLTITLRLKNAFGNVGFGGVDVTIVNEDVPSVSIFGPASLVMNRWATLELFAEASIRICNKTDAFYPLSYQWSAYHGITLDSALQSVSNNPRVFRLNPYSLNVGVTYNFVIQATASASTNSIPGDYATRVTVLRSGVLAEIAGGASRSVSSTDTFVLDASASGDRDFPDSINTTFTWTCQEVSPVFGRQCNTSMTTFSVLNIDASSLAHGSSEEKSFLFSLKVVAYDGLSATVSTTVTVLTNFTLPKVIPFGIRQKYNPSESVVISCEVSTVEDVVIKWNSTDINLVEKASTKISRHVIAPASLVFSLMLRPQSLTPGEFYTFQFMSSASINQTEFVVLTEVTIELNEPPSGGQLSVSPPIGFTLNTSFALSSINWVDDVEDYPLKYVIISYNEERSSASILKFESSIPYVDTVIPQGLLSAGYAVTCETIVTDILDSSASANATAVVKPLNSLDLEAVLTEQLTESLQSFDAELAVAVLTAAAESVNIIDCSAAPDCGSLNRLSCQSTLNTCGECVSGYLGVQGHSNEPCFLISEVVAAGEHCTTNSNCSTGLCVNNTCSHKQRECPQDCITLRHGECTAFDHHGNEINREECTYGNLYCEVKCVCRPSWYGEACTIGRFDYPNSLRIRETMCAGLLASSSMSDVISGDVIVARSHALTTVFADLSLVSVVALHNCTSALTRSVLTAGNGLLILEVVGESLLESLERITLLEHLMPMSMQQDVSDSIIAIISAQLNAQVVGSEQSNILSDKVRLTSLKSYFSTTDGSLIQSPRTTYENLIGRYFSTNIQFDNTNAEENSQFGMSIFENIVNNVNTLSNPVTIASAFDDSSVERRLSSANVKLTAELPNYFAINYTSTFERSEDSFGCVEQKDQLPYNLTISCTSDEGAVTRYSVNCPGNKRGRLLYSCPYYTTFPQCVTFNGTAYEEDASCTVDKYNSTHVTCVCGGVGTSRWLQSTTSTLQTLTLTTITKKIGTSFDVTFSADFEKQPDTFKTTPILFGCLVASVMMVLIGFQTLFLYNQKEKKKRSQHTKVSQDVFADALPVELSELTWLQRFIAKLREATIIGGVFFSQHNRVRFVMKSVLLILTVLLVDILLAFFVYNDDGSCRSATSEEVCVNIRTRLVGEWHSTCQWNDVDDWCTFNQTHVGFMSILYLTIAVLIISLPVLRFTYSLVDVFYASMEIRVKYPKMKSFSKVYIDAFLERTTSKAKIFDVCWDDWENGFGGRRAGWQSSTSKVVLGGRLDVMRRRMDEVTVQEEVKHMGLSKKSAMQYEDVDERTLVSSLLDDYSMPLGGVDVRGRPAAAMTEILKARTSALDLSNDIDTLLGDHAKELMIFRHFLVESLPPHKRQFARRYLCGAELSLDSTIPVQWKVNFSFWFLILFVLAACFFIVFIGFFLDSASIKIWGKVAAFALCQFIFLLDPLFVYMIYICSVTYIHLDVLRMFKRLRDMGKIIMSRRIVGAMEKERCNRLQHFNSACRAARLRPQYLISRLLMQLNDLDIPASYAARPKHSSRIYSYGVMGLFLLLAQMPVGISDVLVYFIFVAFFGTVFAGFYYLFEYNIILAIFTVGFVLALLVKGYYVTDSESNDDGTPSKFRVFLDRFFPCKRVLPRMRKRQRYEVPNDDVPGTSPSGGSGDGGGGEDGGRGRRPLQHSFSSSALVAPAAHNVITRGQSFGSPTSPTQPPPRTEHDLQALRDELREYHKQIHSLKKQNSSLQIISLAQSKQLSRSSSKVSFIDRMDSNM